MYFNENDLRKVEHDFLTTVMRGEIGANETLVCATDYIKGVIDFVNACLDVSTDKEKEKW